MQSTEEHLAPRRLALGVAYALAASIAYAVAQVLTRQLVDDDVSPLVGSTLSLFWGTIGFFAISFRALGEQKPNLGRGSLYFGAAGIFAAIGVAGLFEALGRGSVVVVSPIVSTSPLFTLVFAALLLRGIEQLTPRVIGGAVLVVVGVIVLSL
jgi:drug/metabolite transporter (DMT)-like permease